MLKQGKALHTQITDWLLNQINGGQLKPDQKLPSENELAENFDVSRVTVRRALQTLESQSIIYRCQGLGSFVKDNRPAQSLVKLTDFNEDMKNAGMSASSEVLSFEQVEVGLKLSGILGVQEGKPAFRIERLRLADNEPIAFDITWLPFIYGQLITTEKLSNNTIYNILEKDYEIPVTRGCYRMSAINADKKLAEYLKVESQAALFLIDRISYTIGNKPIYYQKRYYRSDKVLYEMRLERQEGDTGSGTELPLKEFIPIFSHDLITSLKKWL
jgi:GntR family transcriptional regulator